MARRTCECGACKKCRHREYMRSYYHRGAPVEDGFSSGGEVICSCSWCERIYVTTARMASRKRFCSYACKEAETKAMRRFLSQLPKPARSCRHCGREMPQRMRADASYCSAECNANAHKQAASASRRAGAKLARIDRAYIVERDGGRCHICRRVVPDGLISIDHIVPLSKGGEHVPENLALACLPCNVRKRDRAVGEQLLLVG